MNGRTGNDANFGKYTYIGSNGSSVIDYMLSQQDLFEFIRSFDIEDSNILSDHCCVKLVLEFPVKNINFSNDNSSFETVNGRYVWNADLIDEYKSKCSSNSVQQKLQNLNANISSSTDRDAVNAYLTSFNEILSDVCSPFFKKCKFGGNSAYDEIRENPWFNEACQEKRYIFLQKLNIFRLHKDSASREAMAKARSDFKKTIRRARFNFDKQKT